VRAVAGTATGNQVVGEEEEPLLAGYGLHLAHREFDGSAFEVEGFRYLRGAV
jgi:hypothetical protein